MEKCSLSDKETKKSDREERGVYVWNGGKGCPLRSPHGCGTQLVSLLFHQHSLVFNYSLPTKKHSKNVLGTLGAICIVVSEGCKWGGY
ncbi:hypothetical protein SLEP1_g8300 [Rubroshorea leprosula]|uniref:Uncharacterized protein n=1 Tax=Rubroshorea leprosula TaxID=152421 RepID=A0AAV5IC96_9ROSI|nr:hypothetical protein SLEP1_g8300 [Rubroshorea leprosula]